jgi:hypothetical protein
MSSPLLALSWEIWRRGRRSAWLSIACVTFCAVINLAVLPRLHAAEAGREVFNALFGLLMTMSFLLVMGIFNYTEFSSTREWNGFPYRLFTLPLRTWQLVALPVVLAVTSVEALYWAWAKLVWTHEPIVLPEWFAVVFGAYVVFYLAALWCLAGFRILRLLGLGLGGVSAIAVACLPFFGEVLHSSSFTEKRLIILLAALAALAFAMAWAAVSRQRCGGGQRRQWPKILIDQLSDTMPRRTRDFSSPAAAQFWYEWRRSGLLLPACTLFILAGIFGPFSWFARHNPDTVYYVLVRVIIAPIVLAFVIGKAFIKPDVWSMDLAMPSFLAIRPLSADEFVIAKMKAAAVSVIITALLVLGFVALWLPLWADPLSVRKLFFGFHMFYPHSWLLIAGLFVAGLMVLGWRCLVSGLWNGLSGKRSWYLSAAGAQVVVPVLLLVCGALFADAIDQQARAHPDISQFEVATTAGWLLALLVIIKFWFAVFSWSKVSGRRTAQYLRLWAVATLVFVLFAIMARPWADMFRMERLYVLGALLIFPFARLGLAPASLARNRHR